MEFAKQLKKYRLNNDLSQEDLATKLFVSRQAVSKWENVKELRILTTSLNWQKFLM